MILRIVSGVYLPTSYDLCFDVEIGPRLHVRHVEPLFRSVAIVNEDVREVSDIQSVQLADICRILSLRLTVLIVIQSRNCGDYHKQGNQDCDHHVKVPGGTDCQD